MNDSLDLIAAQMKREKDSQQAGYERFLRNEQEQRRMSDGSNTTWAVATKKALLGQIIAHLEERIANPPRKGSSAILNLKLCTGIHLKREKAPDGSWTTVNTGKEKDYWDLPTAAFLALQLALDAALNPNKIKSKIITRKGNERTLTAKPTVTELEKRIGSKLQDQITYSMVEKNFPSWFKRTSQDAAKANEDGLQANTRYWEFRMAKSKSEFLEYLRLNGRDEEADLLCWKPWTYNQQIDVGSWLLSGVIVASGLFKYEAGYREGKRCDYLELSDEAEQYRQQWMEDAEDYCHDLMPMLVKPVPPTNDNMGGWLTPSLHCSAPKFKGSIHLADEQLKFIETQGAVPFRLNQFLYQLIEELAIREWKLGKFIPHTFKEPASVASRLGLDKIDDWDEQDRLIRNHPDFAAAKKSRAVDIDRELAKVQRAIGSMQLLRKLRIVKDDERFFIPTSWDMRARLYSRISFLSFQYSDPGRYVIEFANPTPIDKRTKFWLSVGVANAAGKDKLPFDARVSWVEANINKITCVARMLDDDGDFSGGVSILGAMDDPFAFARLAWEYDQLFIQRTRNYTHCFVCLDASASGTQFHSAWRQNRHGAVQCNLVNGSEPQDIYLSVWQKIKELSLHKGVIHPRKLKALREHGEDRYIVKKGYVPYSYGCGLDRVKEEISMYNDDLAPSMKLSEQELEIVFSCWDEAMNVVASVGSTVGWFKARTEEALNNGAKTIKFTNALGSVMTLKYPKTTESKVRTFHHGSTGYRDLKTYEATDEPREAKLIMAVAANVTHACDAALLASALSGVDFPFVSIHDSVGVPPGELTDLLRIRLKHAFVRVASQDVWTQFLEDNNLPTDDPSIAPPIVGDWDIKECLDSTYMFC